jgi:uncharacterized protein YjbI with pentapeptide repeats
LALFLITVLTLAGMAAGGPDVVQASDVVAKIETGKPVDYSYVIIEGNINISAPNTSMSRHILSPIKITDSIISGSVDFDNTILHGFVNIRRTEFMKPASFIGTEFNRGVEFDGSWFDDNCFFIASRFNSSAHFIYTEFNRSAVFLGSKFGADSDFHNSRFTGTSSFESSLFGDDANFQEAIFTMPSTFREAQFYTANFLGSEFKDYADFDLSQFNKSGDFTGTKFGKELYFNGVKFAKLSIFWDSIKNRLVCDGQTYLLLIKNFKDMEQFEDADNCYYQYRDVKRQERHDDWGKLFDYISWISCGYGVRWQHPIISAIAVAVLFGMYYESCSLSGRIANSFDKQEIKNFCKYDSIQNLKKSMSFSFMLLLSLPSEWSHYGRDEYAKFVTRHWFSGILERLIGWGLMLLLVGTLTRLMVRY